MTTVEIMKSECREKPSKVSFRRLTEEYSLSVRFIDNTRFCMSDEYSWTWKGEPISESTASSLLDEFQV